MRDGHASRPVAVSQVRWQVAAGAVRAGRWGCRLLWPGRRLRHVGLWLPGIVDVHCMGRRIRGRRRPSARRRRRRRRWRREVQEPASNTTVNNRVPSCGNRHHQSPSSLESLHVRNTRNAGESIALMCDHGIIQIIAEHVAAIWNPSTLGETQKLSKNAQNMTLMAQNITLMARGVTAACHPGAGCGM